MREMLVWQRISITREEKINVCTITLCHEGQILILIPEVITAQKFLDS